MRVRKKCKGNLEMWMDALERRGMKVSKNKTENVNGRGKGVPVKLQVEVVSISLNICGQLSKETDMHR